MGLVCPELSLDLKPSYVSETINGFLSEVSMIGDVSERLNKVDGFVTQLEAELNKIEVFKRELPLCMLLLKEAISYLKQESSQYKTRNAHQPVLEEFIPLKKEAENTELNKTSEDDSGKDKKNWMSSVQLWNSPHLIRNSNSNQVQNHVSESPKEDEKKNQNLGGEIHDLSKIRGGSKGFVPLVHGNYPTSNFPELRRKVDKEDVSVSGLTLVVPGMINHPEEDSISRVFNPKLGSTRVSNSSPPASIGRPSHQQPSARKQRRCWSPELHRRFVDALTQLGGPQVATPKQIRELMRVDGLTNDEVKSHLQKYRLHTRRVPNDSGNKNEQAMSGSWTAQDQYSESSKPSSSQSASPEGPLQFPGLTGCTSTTGGDSMDEEDDDKSETHSWKGHAHKTGKDDV
ncbi:transcription factor HHO6-like [Chenopodium quinoa]|uniref:transcription factor HHO6-like n=1 Tax=Chenopodium quinoa TaxID=63459 RepID=UPI000B78DBBB|nr:transcription factor HHO6-like [Chenopodium quinoa]